VKALKTVALGVHILDVLAMPVAGPPIPGGRAYLEDVKITAAGTAAGTAVDLAKLGGEVVAMGAIGDDASGELVTILMGRHGVDTSRIARKPNIGTRVSLLMLGEEAERHTALIYPGANRLLSIDDVDLELVGKADVLHVGGADVFGDFASGGLIEVMTYAREHGVTVTFDLLGTCDEEMLGRLAPALRLADFVFPNEDQLIGLTGIGDPGEAARALHGIGVGCVVGTLSERGSIIVSAGPEIRVPAFAVDAVDMTGCGDAYAAGFITGIGNGWPAEAAAWLGSAAAALVAQGLGSDFGLVDLDVPLRMLVERAPASVASLAAGASVTATR
jgi:sugar/nucleoside kinase (ribokinase family)